MKTHSLALTLLFLSGLPSCARPGATGGTTATSTTPHITTHAVSETTYVATTECGQGPYAIEIPALGARYGEEIELHIESDHRVEFTATLETGDSELLRDKRMSGPKVAREGALDNQRCLAQSTAAGSRGGDQVPSAPSDSGQAEQIETTDEDTFVHSTAPLHLQAVPGTRASRGEEAMLGFSWPEQSLKDHAIQAGATLRFRIWSMVPNDMQGVRFVVVHTKQAPNTSQAEYDAYLASVEEARIRDAELREKRRLEAEILARARAEIRWEREAEKRQRREEREEERRVALEAESRIDVDVSVPSGKKRKTFTEAQLRERERARKKQAERLVQAEQRRIENERRKEEKRIRRAERAERKKRRLALEAQARLILKVQAKARRKAYCDSHLKSTKCWGAGGYKAHAKLEAMKAKAEAFCLAHPAQARCWSQEKWQENNRLYLLAYEDNLATKPGPPPSPLTEDVPPRFSVNSVWRAGYWEWASAQWVWLHGTWQVPQSDVDSGLTTQAPSAPPAPRVEAPALAVRGTLVWVPGFWQWDSKAWIWVAGSYQAPPSATATWSPANWAVRGSVHVLIPGGWKQ
ncbi:MAG: hypothetical protein GY811_24565 [Myxococcales bacterium]|nr:hypothetical protein [Myxococcales bacterium]